MMRKAIALGILTLAAGFAVEAQSSYPQWHRIPLDGAIVVGVASAVMWAERELSVTREEGQS